MNSNIPNSCIIVHEKKILKHFPIYVKIKTPPGAILFVRGSRFLQFRIFTIYTTFCVNIGIFGEVVLEKKIFKIVHM